jgi:uracil-DNA glycosylase family 4
MIEFPHAKLDGLWEDIRSDSAFNHLRQPGIRLVPGYGKNPYVFIVGEAPGATENEKGKPFVGKAGRVLRQLMQLANLSTDKNCWLTNVLKYRPPRNRNPTTQEIKDSKPYLRREWNYIYKPKILVPVGGIALFALGVEGGIMMHAGNRITRTIQQRSVYEIWPMIHPAFALRNEAYQSIVESHWTKFGEWLERRKILP